MKYYVYILQSLVKEHKHYTGHSMDLDLRLKQHNYGKTKSTSPFKPWKIIYFESFDSREEVVMREKYFKSGFGREYLKKILAP